MQKDKLNSIDWDAAAEAERFGALAISRRSKNRGAKMTKYGLTTAQLRVCRESASHLVHILKRVKQPLHIGKTILELTEQGKKGDEELIAKMATSAGITKAAAGNALAAFTGAVTASLKKGKKVSLVNFGTFEVAKRKARTGRNPRTGEALRIPAARVPKFSAGKALKSAVR